MISVVVIGVGSGNFLNKLPRFRVYNILVEIRLHEFQIFGTARRGGTLLYTKKRFKKFEMFAFCLTVSDTCICFCQSTIVSNTKNTIERARSC